MMDSEDLVAESLRTTQGSLTSDAQAPVEAVGNPQDVPMAENAVVDKEDGGRDLSAIKETCTYITGVVSNFNARINDLPVDAIECIKDLNTRLDGLLIRSQCEKGQKSSDQMGFTQPLLGILDTRTGESSTAVASRNTKTNHAAEDDSDSEADAHSPVRCRRPEFYSASALNQGSDRLSMEGVLRALTRLDTRTVPKPEVYDSSCGQKLAMFLATFEEYCQNNFRGTSSLWVGELGRLLSGDMRLAFDALKVPGDSYQSIREKLLKWETDAREANEIDAKSRFHGLQRNSGESLRLLAARLEKYFRLAYPRRNVESSPSLRRKYFSLVPETFREQLETARSVCQTVTSQDLTWSTIQSLASKKDSGDKERSDVRDKERSDVREDEDRVWMCRNTSVPCYDDTGPYWPSATGTAFHECSSTGLRPRGCCEVWQTAARQAFPADGRSRASGSREPPELAPRVRFASPNFEDRTRGRASRETTSSERRCFFCQKTGHLKSECRRFLNQCLVCGSDGHRIADCPKRRGNSITHAERDRENNEPGVRRSERESTRDLGRNNRLGTRGDDCPEPSSGAVPKYTSSDLNW